MKIYFYKLLLGIVLTGVFSFSLGFTLSHVGIISNAVFGVPLLPYAPFKAELAKAILTIISAFYIANKIINFRILGIDCKLNFIFFIAFATIGILALTAVTYIIVFGFMLFGLDLDKKLVAILSAVILFIGTYSTAFSFRKSNYELGKFLQIVSLKRRWNANETLSSILLLIGVIIWLNFIVFESK